MSRFEDELDKIRVEMYEELKDLSNAESAKVIGERVRKTVEQFHIKIITGGGKSPAERHTSIPAK